MTEGPRWYSRRVTRNNSPDAASSLTASGDPADPTKTILLRKAALDPDTETIRSTKQTINKVLLIRARGQARRIVPQPRVRDLRLSVVLAIVALASWIDPTTIVAIIRGG